MTKWALIGQTLKQVLWLTPVVLTVNDCLVGTATINGFSMQPTFNPEADAWKDRIIVNKLSTRLFTYGRGDVVLIRSPREPRCLLVKRLIGLEGDWLLAPGRKDIVKIPKGHCWVEGDNAQNSEDSASSFGPIPMALVQGKAVAICWPPTRIGGVHSAMPHGRLLMRSDPESSVRYVA